MKINTILATKGAKVITIRADQTLREAAEVLAKNRIGALVVVDEVAQLTGIISERDLVQAIAHHAHALSLPVSKVMTKAVIAASPRDELKSVLQTMTKHRIRHLPILDRGQLAGIVSILDVVKAQLHKYEGEIERLHNSA